eukprot:jgi/Bigna1/125970/aug1.1_g678
MHGVHKEKNLEAVKTSNGIFEVRVVICSADEWQRTVCKTEYLSIDPVVPLLHLDKIVDTPHLKNEELTVVSFSAFTLANASTGLLWPQPGSLGRRQDEVLLSVWTQIRLQKLRIPGYTGYEILPRLRRDTAPKEAAARKQTQHRVQFFGEVSNLEKRLTGETEKIPS